MRRREPRTRPMQTRPSSMPRETTHMQRKRKSTSFKTSGFFFASVSFFLPSYYQWQQMGLWRPEERTPFWLESDWSAGIFFSSLLSSLHTEKKQMKQKEKQKYTKKKKKTSTFVWKEATFYKPLAAEKWCLFCIATNCRIELNNPYSHVNPAPPPSPKPNSLKNIKVNTNPYIFVGIWYHRRANIDMLFCIFVC